MVAQVMPRIAVISGLLAVHIVLGATPTSGSREAFRDVASEAGLEFWQFSGATGEHYFPESVGSGGAFFDYDGDGDLDVYLVQGRSLNPARGPAKALVPVPSGWRPGNRLFRNELVPTGTLAFTDVTARAGVGLDRIGMGVATGDFDNDGHVDLYVTNYGPNVLFRNRGDGTFEDVTSAAGVSARGWSTSAAWIDYDRDGRLDLVDVRYVDFDARTNLPCYTAAGERDYCGPQVFKGMSTRVFHNRDGHRFEDVTSKVGVGQLPGPGLGILTGDFDADGWPDFAVANDGAANHLWLNRDVGGSRVFRESGLMRGLAYASDGVARAGMGVAAGDVDGDGREDVVITNLPAEGFTLFTRQPGGIFVDRTIGSRLLRASLPHTGFGVGLADFENRGADDLFAANGAVRVIRSQSGDPYPYHERNLLLRNLGAGRGFEDVTSKAGPALALVEVSRAAVFGDVDNDGGIDVLVTNNNGPARLLRNTLPDRGHWLLVALEGTRSARSAYGSEVTLRTERGVSSSRIARSDGSYLAAHDPRIHFGLGSMDGSATIEVRWLGGVCEEWAVAHVDAVVTLQQGSGRECGAGGRSVDSAGGR
jgi:enediyne biosynthesis protein E4